MSAAHAISGGEGHDDEDKENMAVVELLRQSLQLVNTTPPQSPTTASSPTVRMDTFRSLLFVDSPPTTAGGDNNSSFAPDDLSALLPQNLVEDNNHVNGGRGGAGRTTSNAAAPPPSMGPTILSPDVRQRLDAGALQALADLETDEADAIAFRLEQAGTNVRNPSAYVHRAVNNARRRVGGPLSTAHATNQHLLDQCALAALGELPIEAAQAILDELSSKGSGVRNPSAYVVKAVGNARRGDQVGVPQPGYLTNAQRLVVQSPQPYRLPNSAASQTNNNSNSRSQQQQQANNSGGGTSGSSQPPSGGNSGTVSIKAPFAAPPPLPLPTSRHGMGNSLIGLAQTSSRDVGGGTSNNNGDHAAAPPPWFSNDIARAAGGGRGGGGSGGANSVLSQQSSSDSSRQLGSSNNNNNNSTLASTPAWANSALSSSSSNWLSKQQVVPIGGWTANDIPPLDPKASAALAALPSPQASQIITELQRKRSAIRNPSAYVMRATANAHARQIPNSFQQQQQQQQQLHRPPTNPVPQRPVNRPPPSFPPPLSYIHQPPQPPPPPPPHGTLDRFPPFSTSSGLSDGSPKHACST